MLQLQSKRRLLAFNLPLPLTEIMSPAFMVVLLFVTVAQLTRTSPLLDYQRHTVSSVTCTSQWDSNLGGKISLNAGYGEIRSIIQMRIIWHQNS